MARDWHLMCQQGRVMRRTVLYGVAGYTVGFAVALAVASLVTTTFTVGLILGAGLTLLGWAVGLALDSWRD